MITLTKPSESVIVELLETLQGTPFNYDAVGCIARSTPAGFVRDEAIFEIGRGAEAWEAACHAIRDWRMFPESMAETVRLPSDSIEPATSVAVVCKAGGVWTVNPSRILASHDSVRNGRHRFGFTYGTLPGHVAKGEESFCVEWDESTDVVTFQLVAVSRPNHILCWITYPYTRMMQARFRRLSGQAMAAIVQQATTQNANVRERVAAPPELPAEV